MDLTVQVGASGPKQRRIADFLIREGGNLGQGVSCWMAETLDSFRCRVPIFPLWSTPRTGLVESLMDCSDRLAERISKCVQGLRRAPDLRRQGVDFLFSIRNLKNAPCFSNDRMRCPKALGDVQPSGASEIWPWLSPGEWAWSWFTCFWVRGSSKPGEASLRGDSSLQGRG